MMCERTRAVGQRIVVLSTCYRMAANSEPSTQHAATEPGTTVRGWAQPHAPWGQSINAASRGLPMRCVVGFETVLRWIGIPTILAGAVRVVAHDRRKPTPCCSAPAA